MSGGFEADAGRLAARARDFASLVDRAGEIAADLDRALERAETAWGHDVVGRSFAAAHAEPARRVADQVRGLATGLDHVGGSFAEAARRYQEGDSAAENAISDAARE
ncbi:hypothetical protein [Amycolatopsis pigmentata]|uniref:Excreted virulence factor EspC, type VII ESX diderm n=1 Tax=Amycolatopsis pigmentata TaxID=450801 RepID=A0ABW5G8P8_9PSEU